MLAERCGASAADIGDVAPRAGLRLLVGPRRARARRRLPGGRVARRATRTSGAIAWAREHLPGIDFAVSPQDPPLPYDDGAFDFVVRDLDLVALRRAGRRSRWLDEMHRIIRPGGRLVLTTHGLQSVAYYAQHRRALARPARRRSARALYRTGFWFAPRVRRGGRLGRQPPASGERRSSRPSGSPPGPCPRGRSRTSRSARTPATRTSTSCAAAEERIQRSRGGAAPATPPPRVRIRFRLRRWWGDGGCRRWPRRRARSAPGLRPCR